jgi:hypothetical protein
MGEAASSEVTHVAAATSSQDPEVGLAAVAAPRGLSVGLPRGYRGAAGPLLAGLGVDLQRLREAVAVDLGGVRR